MPNPLTPLKSTLDLAFLADHLLATLIRGLLQSGSTLITRPLVRFIRVRRGGDPVSGERAPGHCADQPSGPFRLAAPDQACVDCGGTTSLIIVVTYSEFASTENLSDFRKEV